MSLLKSTSFFFIENVENMEKMNVNSKQTITNIIYVDYFKFKNNDLEILDSRYIFKQICKFLSIVLIKKMCGFFKCKHYIIFRLFIHFFNNIVKF